MKHAKSNFLLTNFAVSRHWEAKWIWHEHAPERNAYVLFRQEFEVDCADDIRLFITADTRYRAWINGQMVGDGPPQSQPYHQYYDERDISDHVHAGLNCIGVLVHFQGVQDATRGGLLAQVVDGQGLIQCATGNGDWRALVGEAWRQNTQFSGGNKIGPFQEHVDLRRMPRGWLETGFDDRFWQVPKVISSRGTDTPPRVMPWCRLVPRDIAFLEERFSYARAIQTAEECLDLATRPRMGDRSISLSQAGRPVDWAKVENIDNILKADGETILACSDRHRDGVSDGRYDPCITLDFGRVLAGFAEIEVEAPAGAHLEIGYAERLVDERFNNAIECSFADRVICVEGANVFRPLVWRSFRYLRLRVKYCEAGLRIKAVRAAEVKYPYEKVGQFQGDDRFERIFEICRNTLELCSIESLMDTPFREQAQWLGDVAAVTVPGIYACFGDTDLPGKFLRQAALNTRPTGLLANISNVVSRGWQHDIPDYSLWWVIGLWRHYQYTGDVRYLHECYPEMQRVMRPHLERVNEDGLLEPMFGWTFIDWANVDLNGISAPYNAIFAGACDAAAAIARLKNDVWAEEIYAAAAAGVRGVFAKTFVDSRTGAVADAIQRDALSTQYSEHASAAAIAFDCVDEKTAESIIEAVFDKHSVDATEAQPFFMVVVLEALRKAGRVDLALDLIEDRWGKRMVDRGRTSCTEEWYENGSWRGGDWYGFERTHSHAWSAAPAEFLITGLAGIEILDPGCTTLRVHPFDADFAYEIVYPTPQGKITVAWDGENAEVNAPENIEIVHDPGKKG